MNNTQNPANNPLNKHISDKPPVTASEQPGKPKTGSRKKTQVRSKNGTYSVKLTAKQKAFADRRLNYPKESATESVDQTYNITDRKNAGSLASENMNKPSIIHYLEVNRDRAQQVVTNMMELENSEKLGEKRLAYDSATQVLDRTIGKPIQRTESASVNINIDTLLEDMA